MSDQDAFDRWVRDEARGYNEPAGEIPREAMWRAIAAQVPRAAARTSVRWWRTPMVAAAAAALLIVGYALGRRSSQATPNVATSVGVLEGRAEVYDAATRQYLGRADALFTSVRGAAIEGTQVDAALNAWARDMLADTRLLLDSPLATDVNRRRLLLEIELHLAQIVQLSAAGTANDKQLLERGLKTGELLTRIRTAMPLETSGT